MVKFHSFNGYDLSHLTPFSHTFIQQSVKDKTAKSYNVIFEFSHHCFTKSPNGHKGETLDDYEEQLHYKTERE